MSVEGSPGAAVVNGVASAGVQPLPIEVHVYFGMNKGGTATIPRPFPRTGIFCVHLTFNPPIKGVIP